VRAAANLRLPFSPAWGWLTAQGHPKWIFKRAIERGNLPVTAREVDRLTLDEALALTALVAGGTGASVALRGALAGRLLERQRS
jgi:hypothetical protein